MVANLHKYLIFFQLFWQNGLAYPFSFLLWRARQLLSTLMSLTIWTLIFAHQANAFGYDRSQMISYIFLISLLQGTILATQLHSLAGEIYSGTISQLLIKPIAVFNYLAASEVADKLKNVALILVEMSIFYLIFRPQFVLPVGLQRILNLTPFPYLAYVQTQLFLGRLNQDQIISYSIGLVTWTAVIAGLAISLWRKGNQNYAAAGN